MARMRIDLRMLGGGISLKRILASALRRVLGLRAQRRSNGLARLAGGWNEGEFAAFERDVQELDEEVDEELWR